MGDSDDSNELDFLDDDEDEIELKKPVVPPSKPVVNNVKNPSKSKEVIAEEAVAAAAAEAAAIKQKQKEIEQASIPAPSGNENEVEEEEVEEGEEKDDGTSNRQEKESKEIQQQNEEDRRSVFVQNVEYCTTKEELQEIFKDCGAIQKITIPQSRIGQGKGFAYIQFADVKSVELAKSVSDHIHRGRTLKVFPKRTNQHGFKKKPSSKPSNFNHSYPFMRSHAVKGFSFGGGSSYGYKKSFNPH